MLDPTAELTPRLYCGVKLTRSWEFAEGMISAVCNAMQGSEPDLRYVRKPARDARVVCDGRYDAIRTADLPSLRGGIISWPVLRD